MGLLRFYRHVLWLACRHSLGVADASFYGVLVVLALAAWWRPELPETIGLTERQIILCVFGTVIVARLLMAPYWVLRGKQDEKSASIRMRKCRRMRDEGRA